ncbi:MAG TPA: hypothetical protein VFT74_07470 [Isosphaeraceae bacterium]|nr:hypothetical protein [Isosphaeraceae bacterium]
MGALVGATMARAKGRGKRSERDDIAVKIDRAIVGKARLIATHRGISVAELLSDMLVTPVDRAYAQMLRELERREGEDR